MMEKTFLSFRIHSYLSYYSEEMFGNLGKAESDFFPSLETGYSRENKHPQITF